MSSWSRKKRRRREEFERKDRLSKQISNMCVSYEEIIRMELDGHAIWEKDRDGA